MLHMKHYLTHILKCDNSSGDMNERVDHWYDYFENFHKNHIIMPSESLNSSLIEEILFMTVRSPPGLTNKENEAICYLNVTIHMLYFNVSFRQLIINIDCYNMMFGLDKNNNILFIITKIS